jgi:hypothetical protein
MGASILQQGVTIQCPHGGMVLIVPSQSKVLLNGMPALLPADAAQVVGCVFTVGPKPQPCVSVQWSGEATKVKVTNQAPLLATSVGMCKSAEGVVQGIAIINGAQAKVSGL